MGWSVDAYKERPWPSYASKVLFTNNVQYVLIRKYASSATCNKIRLVTDNHAHSCLRKVRRSTLELAGIGMARRMYKERPQPSLYVRISYYIVSIQVMQCVIRLGQETKSKTLLDGCVRMY